MTTRNSKAAGATAPAIRIRGIAKPSSSLLGSKAGADRFHNCLTCSKFSACRDSAKRFDYRCSLYKPQVMLDMPSLTLPEAMKGAPASHADSGPYRKASGASQREEEAASRLANNPGSDIDFSNLVRKALDSATPGVFDADVDDTDIDLAANVYEWLSVSHFYPQSIPLFPKQLELLVRLQGEWCPLCSDKEFVEDIPHDCDLNHALDKITFLRHGRCPKCSARKANLVIDGHLPEYYRLGACVGQRSSKTSTANLCETYNIHRWLKLPKASMVFNQLDDQPFASTYVSLNMKQSKDNMFDPLVRRIKKAPWFIAYHRFLDERAEANGQIKPYYKHGELSMVYRHRNMLFYLAAANKRTLRGYTRMSVIFDELGWFPYGKENEGNEKMTGEEVYDAMSTSMQTLVRNHDLKLRQGYDNLPKPCLMAISSPQSVNDMIMKLVALGRSDPNLLTYHLPTWKFNPQYTRESLEHEFKADFDKASRNYGAQPPLSSSAWIPDKNNVAPLFNTGKNAIRARQFEIRNKKTGSKRTSAELVSAAPLPDNRGRILALDLGLVDNSLALLVASTDGEGSLEVEGMAEVMPSREAPISLSAIMDNLILPIISDMNVKVVVCDQFQSETLLDTLSSEYGLTAQKHSLRYDEFADCRQSFYDKEIVFPKVDTKDDVVFSQDNYPNRFHNFPIGHLLFQILSVKDIPGKKVDKGAGVTDDLFRCLVLAHWASRQAEFKEELLGSGEIISTETAIGVLSATEGGAGAAGFTSSFGISVTRGSFDAGQAAGNMSIHRSDISSGQADSKSGSSAIGIIQSG